MKGRIGRINPGRVFDLTLPLAQVAEGYRAMDERRAIKTLLTSVGVVAWSGSPLGNRPSARSFPGTRERT
jgi:hypothetical protein